VRLTGGGHADARAGELAERARQIAEHVTTPPGRVDLWGEPAYFAIAESLLWSGDVRGAEELMQGRLQAWEHSGARRSFATTARFLSRCAEARGDWATAARMLARGAIAAGEDGLLCERWQIEGGLARVAVAADRPDEAEDRRGRARQLIDAIAAAAGDEQMGMRFRERALAEIDRPVLTPRH
jgi:hypothetical protein